MALSQRGAPIAIVGVGLRVPGAETPEEFLRLLRGRMCRIGAAPEGRGVSRPGGYLEQVDAADWRALGIPPREMRQVDPQHRLLLEIAREALEDAGLTRKRLAESRVGVASGLIWDDYLRELERNGAVNGYTVLGNVASFAANRISFHFDFKGPSVALNAACASGLVAVHEACRILRLGEADVALAGACELMLSAESDRMMEGLGVLSPSGRCLPLDARADGFVRGEGAGMAVLKRLSDVDPWERVYAVIAGSAVNHNGRNEWLMASSEAALEEVVRGACAEAGIGTDELSYVELHGSGGPKGDAAELRALAQAGAACGLGSLKGNLGHLGAASGIVSLIKVALGMREREWLPMVLEEPRTDVDWGQLRAVRSAEKWSGEAFAGVTATSLSGTNAHVVLKSAGFGVPDAGCGAALPPLPARYRVPVWGHTRAALEQRAQELKEWVKEHPEVAPADVAFTCAHGRDALAFAGEVEIGEGELAAIPESGRIVSLPLFPWQRERFSAARASCAASAETPVNVSGADQQRRFATKELQGVLQETLQLPEPPPMDAGFFELGLNSMALAELSAKLGVPATAFFEFPTIGKLAEEFGDRESHLSDKNKSVAKVGRRDSAKDPKVAGTAIAVVGMGCRFSGGADSPERFWELLLGERDGFGPVPAGRNVPLTRGAFLDEVDGFDAAFFRISPKEAAQMDPQQRLFLEVTWEALENAGVDASRLQGSRTGVYAGAFAHDYSNLGGSLQGPADAYHFSGVDIGFNANRVSFALGLRGPSLTVDTACSSSLVALHLAVRALCDGECEMALAGGVSLMLSPEISEFLEAAGTLSPGGICRAFDRDADGMARGEGCGVVVLKRLEDAVAAGDNVLAVIRGTAVNHGGASGGLTVPNPVAQAELYWAALADAGAEAGEVVYLEAHGTGTKLGDPVELRGIAEVYTGPLGVGTVKTKIGHADAAAGIAGLIKAVLMLRAGEIPAERNFREPTAEFDWAGSGIHVPKTTEKLPAGLVAVSSFGLGGTNAHVVLEGRGTRDKGQGARDEGQRDKGAHGQGDEAVLLALSARSEEALGELAAAWARELESGAVSAVDAAWTAGRSRAGLAVRAAVAGRGSRELAAKLRDGLEGVREAFERTELRTAFVFPGQGGQWAGMGRGLMEANPVFRAKIAEIDETFRALAGRGILEFAPNEVHETRVAQPAIFAMQVGLAAAWRAMGVRPDVVVGHSMGEIAAACVAGCLPLGDAVRVIYERSRVLEEASGGRMLVASLSAEEATELVEPFRDAVAVGVVNGPRSVVLSGDAAAIRVLAEELRERDVFCREVQVRYASHCPQVGRFREPVRRALEGIQPREGETPFRSTMLGRVVSGTELDADYWAANFCEPVRFSDAVEALAREGVAAFVEMSPHPTLDISVAACLEAAGSDAVVGTSLRRDAAEDEALLESVGRLYCAGYPVDFARVNPAGRVVELPNYPWQRKRYWIAAPGAEGRRKMGAHPLLGERVKSPLPQEQYQSAVSRNQPEWLAGHGLRGEVYFPAAGFVEMALAARAGSDKSALRDVKFEAPLLLGEDAVRLQLTIDSDRFTIHSSRDGDEWERHVTGVYGGTVEAREWDVPGELRDVDGFYEGLERRGYWYEDAFRAVTRVEVGEGAAVAEVARTEGGFRLHPASLDGCLQAALALTESGLLVPVGMDGVEVLRGPVGDLRAAAVWREEKFDIEIFDAEGICTRVAGLQLKEIGGERAAWEPWCFQTAWVAALPQVASGRSRLRVRVVGADGGLNRFLEERGQVCVEDGAADHVVYLAEGEDLERMYGEALRLAQELETVRPAPRLWIVTRGAQAVAGEAVNAAQAGLWGLGRVIAREIPGLGCTCVDVEGADWRELWREIAGEAGERQVMLRGGKRYVPRVEPVRFAETRKAFRIGVESYGQLEGLRQQTLEVREPGAGEVRIRTEIVPLNFRDVLNALGMLPEYAAELGIHSAEEMPFGFECSGVVEAVGRGVTKVAVGDRVVAGPVTGALASHVVADARRVLRVPEGVDAAELACLPVAWMTASYGLETLAKLKAGEKVLIHAAAGGVGMAAIGIAQRIGAEVVATASPEKWAVLRAMGVTEIYSSRNAGFAEAGIQADVVLNSLTGEMIAASLRACGVGARFIEIGKKAIRTADEVRAVRPDVEYHAFTFSEVADERPELVEEMLGRMGEAPRLPVTRFGVGEVAAAFRYMAQARHVGKVAIAMGRGGMEVRPDGTYWVTGGGGALGRLVAEWLVARGAGRVVVSGRRASTDWKLGERVEYRRCDVSSVEAVEALVREIGGELRGIVHAAGVIEDAPIAAQSAEKFGRVNAAKAVAARNLSEATAGLKLDFMVLFSSTAAVLGPAGQANYAAANAAMDAMAHNLQAAGRPALSIEWGPWGEVGLAAELNEASRRRLAGRGMEFMEPRLCLEAMDALMGTGLAVTAVAPVDWERFVADLPEGCSAAMFERVTKARSAAKRDWMAEMAAVPEGGRRAMLEGLVREQIARSLGLADGGAIGERQRLFDLGFDSLMAVELRNRLEAALKRPLRRTLVFDFPRVGGLVEHLAEVLGLKGYSAAEVEEEEQTVEGNAEIEERLAAASQLLGEQL